MSDDDDDVVAPSGRQRRKTLIKGRKRPTVLDDDDESSGGGSSSDDDIFEEKDTPQKPDVFKAPDFSFSPDNFNRAMKQLEKYMNKTVKLPPSIEKWEPLKEAFEASRPLLVLGDLEPLMKFIKKNETLLTPEFKAILGILALNTCKKLKSENDAKKAQLLFKSKDKTDKVNHVANFVSNKWVADSFQHLKALPSLKNDDDNMHFPVLENGLIFMTQAFVIDTEKKLNVLKDKQNIDWETAANKVMRYGLTKSLVRLSHNGGLAKRHFDSFKSKDSIAAVEPSAASADNPETRRPSIAEMAKKKREDRIQAMKMKARDATGGVTATLARRTSATGGDSWGNSQSTAKPGGDHQSSAKSWGNSQSTSTTWGKPASSDSAAKAKTWGSAPAKSSGETWGKPAQSSGETWGKPAPKTWGESPANADSWGKPAPKTWGEAPAKTWGEAQTAAPKPAWGNRSSASGDSDTPRDSSATSPGSKPSWGSKPSESNDRSRAEASEPNWGKGASSASSENRSWGQPSAPSSDPPSSKAWGSPPAPSGSSWGKPPEPKDSGWGKANEPSQTSESKASTSNSWGGTSSVPQHETSSNRVSSSHAEDSGSWGTGHSSGNYADDRTERYSNPEANGTSLQSSHYQGSSNTREHSESMYAANGELPSSGVVGSGSAGARGRGWGDNVNATSSATANTAGPNLRDNQSDMDSSFSGAQNNKRSRGGMPYDGGDDRGGFQGNRNGNKRSRHDRAAPPSHPPADSDAGGMGRGRGRTLPAWMTKQGNDALPGQTAVPAAPSITQAIGGPAAPSTGPNFSMDLPPRNGGTTSAYPPGAGFQAPPPGLQGTGRGRGRTLPAWMTKGQDGGPSGEAPAPTSAPPVSLPPPAAAPPPQRNSFNEPPAAMGRGRGRGRTLPAWMTNQQQ